MSPARPSSRRNSSGSFKPYTRGVTPIMVSSIEPKSPNLERPGFPTYSQYKQVETAYLQSLTPRRQGKALISQALFDRIWDVLHQPEAQGETAQFRFWARKMFTVSKTHRVTLGVVDNTDMNGMPQEVLLHDNLLVAIQEQLYDLLCYCHGSTGHGGRDKTCALIRKHYTWVPKDLVSNFIKACPTCIMKKCGNMDSAQIVSQIVEPKAVEEANLPAMRDFFQHMYGAEGTAPPSSSSPCNALPWPSMGGPRDHLPEDPLEAAYREAILRSRAMKPTLSGLGTPNSRGLHGAPMTREVSLYKGLPNGWQYRHSDYASAHAEFMRTKDLPAVDEPGLGVDAQRPRIPSIVPLWGPDQFPHPEYHGLVDDLEHSHHHNVESDQRQSDTQLESSEMSMHYLLMASQGREKPQEYIPQIDPSLMDYSGGSSSGNNSYHLEATEAVHSEPNDNGHIASTANFPSSSSINRPAAAPLRINLEFPAEKTFQALLAYRDSLGDGNLTPESPLMRWHPGNPSPASSESETSQLSAFPTSTTTTPASSALPTPVDEFGSQAATDIKGKQGIVVPEGGPTQEEDQELSNGIQIACGL